MQPRDVIHLVVVTTAAIAFWHYRNEIIDAIRRGPWNGGGPTGIGPAPAADPFTHCKNRKSPHQA
ncbi:MAG: hypothetical protein U0R19_01505 [Bryobacteraceae bacterium]